MTKKKICLLGPFGVGKTSLISRYVRNIFSTSYLSTIGVKVDKKDLALEGWGEVCLLIWDLEGRDDFASVTDTYLRGMAGYLLVADGTSRASLDSVAKTRELMAELFVEVPSLLLLNKADLGASWTPGAVELAEFEGRGIEVLSTSAKDGRGVEAAFRGIALKMLAPGRG